MKKITALVLALGLVVPAQAWHLFPVREKVVIETKTNYKVTAVTGVASLIAGLAVGLGILWWADGYLVDRHNTLGEINGNLDYQLREMTKQRDNLRKQLSTARTDCQTHISQNIEAVIVDFNSTYSPLGLTIERDVSMFRYNFYWGNGRHTLLLNERMISYITTLIANCCGHRFSDDEEDTTPTQEGVES